MNEEIKVKVEENIKEYLRRSREQQLIKRGLYINKFYDAKEITKEMKKKLKYSESQRKYYEVIPYDVTDEQYDEILKTPIINENTEAKLSTAFYCIGCLTFLFGAVGGIGAIGLSWVSALIVWVSTFFSGMLFIGFGKIIELLNSIKNKL